MFVRAGFFQGEFLSGNFSLVFQQCFHSSWRTEAAVLSLVNKKAKAQFPAGRTNTHSCWEGSPRRPVHGGGPGSSCLPFLLLLCHSCRSQPRNASAACFQKPLFMSLLTTLRQLSGIKMLHSSLRKDTSFTQTHFKMCPQKNVHGHHNIHQRLLLYIKPETLGILNALFTLF